MNKLELRAWAKEVRADISDDQRQGDAIHLKNNVITRLNDSSIRVIQNGGMDCMDKPCNDGGLVVGTYYPIGTEIIPPHKLSNTQMALPVIRDKMTLEFYKWSLGDALAKCEFNIPIPDTRGLSPITPDIILLPLLLCDTNGNRIGYGAGHYDRYIASCDTKPLLVGVCFDEQIYDGDIPAEPHDQKLDLIITPRRVIEIP
jgi:5-formyltetrahydrofolate cyclo-ligase